MLRLRSGVELPNAITRALEDEQLVLFCGAGISKYTGLPEFREMTKNLFDECGVQLRESVPHGIGATPAEIAYQESKFDRALELLERAVGRSEMRNKVIQQLSRDPPPDEEVCGLHRALLDLAALSGGGHRLVTTNFDDRFHRAAKHAVGQASLHKDSRYVLDDLWAAPRIATPRLESWRSLTFLHGRITDAADQGADNLIITSADFGRAYLQDGWAARFIVELFREFTVLFIGYSINDPVMTYLVDAIALDRESGKPFRQPYAFAPYDSESPEEGAEESHARWKSRNVTPILYPSTSHHIALRKTIEEWSALHVGGFESRLAKALEITRHPHVPAVGMDKESIENLVWALSKADGSVAKGFAGSDPQPHISWLQPLLEWSEQASQNLSEARNRAPSQGRRESNTDGYGVFCCDGYWIGDPLSPPMERDTHGEHIRRTHVFGCDRPLPQHPVARHMVRWIVKHLDNPELARIVAERQGRVGQLLRDAIVEALANRQEPFPGDLEKFWRIVIVVHDAEVRNQDRFWHDEWARQQVIDGRVDYDVRAHLLALLEPTVRIETPWHNFGHAELDADGQPTEPGTGAFPLRSLAKFDVGLHTNDIEWARLRGGNYMPTFAALAAEFGESLAKHLRLAEWVEDKGPLSYRYMFLPNLQDHADWRILVGLCRDALEHLTESDVEGARLLLILWCRYARESWGALFLRLVLHACGREPHAPDVVMPMVLDNVHDVLWSRGFAAELLPFLRSLHNRCSVSLLRKLDRALRCGPPAEHWSREKQRDWYREIADDRFVCLVEAGIPLTRSAERRGRARIEVRQAIGLAEAELGTERDFDKGELVSPPDVGVLTEGSPEQTAHAFLAMDEWDAGNALAALAQRDISRAFKVFDALRQKSGVSNYELLQWLVSGLAKTESKIGPRLLAYIDGTSSLPSSLWGYCDWLCAAAKTLSVDEEDEAAFWPLWDRIWSLEAERCRQENSGESGDLHASLNAPGGKLAVALMDRLWKREPDEDAGFPRELAERFMTLAVGDSVANRHARCLFASRLVWLYRANPVWCDQYLIACMRDFTSANSEVRALWEGFLWPTQVSTKLWPALKPALLTALCHAIQFDKDSSNRLIELFVWLWLRQGYLEDADDQGKLLDLFREFNAEQLNTIAMVFGRALRQHGDRAAMLWHEQIAPRIHEFWPLRKDAQSSQLNETWGETLLCTREAFADALRLLTTDRPVLGHARRLDVRSRMITY